MNVPSSRVRNIAFWAILSWLQTKRLVSLSAKFLCLIPFLSTAYLEFYAIPIVQIYQFFSILLPHDPTFASICDYVLGKLMLLQLLSWFLATFLFLRTLSNFDTADFPIMILPLIFFIDLPSLVTIEPKKSKSPLFLNLVHRFLKFGFSLKPLLWVFAHFCSEPTSELACFHYVIQKGASGRRLTHNNP
jgi:hypothetical protein